MEMVVARMQCLEIASRTQAGQPYDQVLKAAKEYFNFVWNESAPIKPELKEAA